MLGGIDPVIIFHRYKKVVDPTLTANSTIPVVSTKNNYVDLPPIPIYLSEQFTGIFVDSESKNIDIETETQTQTDGSVAQVDQKGISSGVSINLIAKKDSLGMAILSAFMDQLFDKVTSKEYAITYLHGATTIFLGLLHTFAVDQNSTNELLSIKVELSKGAKQPTKPPTVTAVPGQTAPIPGG